MSYRDSKENLHIPRAFIATWCVSTEQQPEQGTRECFVFVTNI